MSILYSPWSAEQIERLEARQAADWLHEYTCGVDSRHPPLVPTTNGWVCSEPGCTYSQDWCHDCDANEPLMKPPKGFIP